MVVDSRDIEEGVHSAENWDREAVDDNGKKDKPVNDCEWLVLGLGISLAWVAGSGLPGIMAAVKLLISLSLFPAPGNNRRAYSTYAIAPMPWNHQHGNI